MSSAELPVWLEREVMLAGEEAVKRLSDSTVAVVGVGGVGGYAVEMVVRAGVGRVIIADSDLVSESNKNRQIVALSSTVGRPKVEVLKERLLDINPLLEVVTISEYLTPDNIQLKLESAARDHKVDFLIDAIDTLSPKLSLITYCLKVGIPIVSSMGSGAKWDISKVRIADISKSFNCPLAYIVRKKLRKVGIEKGFKVVFSEELPQRSAIVETEGEQNKKSQVGTISYIPPVFGCACAQAAIESILEK